MPEKPKPEAPDEAVAAPAPPQEPKIATAKATAWPWESRPPQGLR